MGQWVMGQWVEWVIKFGWVRWVMGHCAVTHDPYQRNLFLCNHLNHMRLTDQDRIDHYLRLLYSWSNFLRFLLTFLGFKKLLNF